MVRKGLLCTWTEQCPKQGHKMDMEEKDGLETAERKGHFQISGAEAGGSLFLGHSGI